MVKAVFFDVDGTLVDFDTHVIPDSARQALKLMKRQGIRLFVASGRHNSSLGELEQMEFDGFITSNGQYCRTKDTLVYSNPIDPDDIRSLAAWLNGQENPIPIIFCGEHDFFINICNDEIIKTHRAVNIAIPPVRPVEEAFGQNIYQISPYIASEEEPEFLRHMPNCRATRWTQLFADVIPKSGSKANGIDKMLEHFGIPLEQSMSFGDGGNDIQMIKHTGIGVAMGNSSDNVKQAADYVTTSIMEDGIYNALKHFCII